MSDGEQEPGSEVGMDGVEAAEKRYDEASPEDREAAWLELWHARDFTWRGKSEKAMLQTEMVEVPASFPDGREAEGEFKTVSLKDYWRWSIGLPGEERLLTDEEMREAGLLVEVDGETYHLTHAPDMGLKTDEQGTPLQILTDIVTSRGKRVPEDTGIGADGNPNFTRALQLRGGWLPGELLRHAAIETAVRMSGARVSYIDLSSMKVGPLNCVRSLFTGKANFESAIFGGMAAFQSATFSGEANFNSATFFGEANFSSTTFSGEADFPETAFNGKANFAGAIFNGDTHFPNAAFYDDVHFTDSTFSFYAGFWQAKLIEEADFAKATFSGDAFFEDANFYGNTKFSSATFQGLVNFKDASFSSRANFREATFQDQTNFGSATFRQEADFSEANFSEHAHFTAAAFQDVAEFRKVNFRTTVDFRSVVFHSRSRFYAAVFAGESQFGKAVFSIDADFKNAEFKGLSSFHAAVFIERSDFSGVMFEQTAIFQSTTFSGFLSFIGATFNGRADFSHAILIDKLTFANSTFHSTSSFDNVQWPEGLMDNAFRNVRFHDRADFILPGKLPSPSAFNETRFDVEPIFCDLKQRQAEIAFRSTIQLTLKSIANDRLLRRSSKKAGTEYEGPDRDERWASLSGGYRTMKIVAERKGDFLLSQTYYRFEVKTRVKRPEIAFWEKVAAALYGLSSDYGNSIARPFVSLAVILAGFAAIYLALAIEVNLVDWQDRAALQSGYFESLDFSLKNVFRPLSALSTDAPREGDASSLAGKLLNSYGKGFGLIVTAISIVQSLTGIVLAFLFGLAVRRRFQIS